MSYNEQYISTARSIRELIDILNNDVPEYADIVVGGGERSSDVEVWYDDGSNTVILK